MSMTQKLAPIAFAAALVLGLPGPAARAQSMVSGNGALRALVVGIDDYLYVPRLRGATADARDLENTLRNLGVQDLRVMLNASATRGSLLVAFQQLVDRTQPGDTIFLSLSGHGAQEPERIKGSEPDGMDAVFLLAGFDPTSRERNGEKILDKEFNHFIRQIEERGGKVLFVADTCSGGGLAREVDPRADEMSYRSVKYTAIQDDIHPVVERVDAMSTPADFKTSIFLAAVDKQSKVPEVRVPGVGFRGALSYAVARGLEGAADLDGNGAITASELFDYSGRVSYQLSDQRQKIITISGRETDPRKTVVATADRGIAVVVGTPGPDAKSSPVARPAPAAKPEPPRPTATKVPEPRPQQSAPAARQQAVSFSRIRVATLDGQKGAFADLAAQVPFDVVSPRDNPDLVWDLSEREVVVHGDVVARQVDRNDLPGLIERTAAIEWLKSRVAHSPQAISVLPNDRVHRFGSRVAIDIGQLSNRFLILFNIAGDGTVQMLYPVRNDPAQRREPSYRLQVQVQPPFGSDQVVAVTSSKRLPDLETAIRQLDRRRNPVQIATLLNRYADKDTLVGTAAMFTSP